MNLKPHVQKIARHLLGKPNEALSSKGQWRYGTKGSLAIEITGDDAGAWFDHEAGAGGGILDLVKREKGYTNGEAFAWLETELGIKEEASAGAKYKVTGEYLYRDRDGQVLYRVVRQDAAGKPKKIFQQRYDQAAKSYVSGKGCMDGVRYIPYRLDLWVDEDEPVLIAEGEGKVDALFDLGRLATCNAGGAGKFSRGFAIYFQDRDVVILPDNDSAGRDHAQQVAAIVAPVAASVRILELPGLPDKGDVIDWLAAGGTKEMLQGLIEAAPTATEVIAGWQPEPKDGPGPEAEPVDTKGKGAGFERQGDFISLKKWIETAGGARRGPGVYREVEEKDPETGEKIKKWAWFCSPLDVVADTRNAISEAWGRLLVVEDRDGQKHEWAMPMSMLAGPGVEYRSILLSLGLQLAPSLFGKNCLHEYVTLWRPGVKMRCVERIGWNAGVFVLPDRTFGDHPSGERVLLQLAGTVPTFAMAGSLAGWQAELAALAVGNSRLAFSIAAGFAGPFLKPVGEESGGYHHVGGSSIGKTTALEVAASVWGRSPDSWRTTDNAGEGLARGTCDTLLCLDEISQADPRVVDAIAYMLANGQGKARMRRDATNRDTITWRVMFLSTGEKGLGAKLAEVNRRAQAGQGVRVIEIPADAGAGLGLFEDLHGSADGDAFSRRIKAAAKVHTGHAGRAFLEKVVPQIDSLAKLVIEARAKWVEANCPQGADGQVRRVAGRFGLVAAAGELAIALAVLPWPAGEADRAAAACFKAWLGARGCAGPLEIQEGIAQVRAFLEAHGSSRFEDPWQEAEDAVKDDDFDKRAPNQRTINRAGFRRRNADDKWIYFVLPEIWRTEVCKGLDATAIARAMIEAVHLEPGDGRNSAKRVAVPGHGKPRLYCIAAAFFDDGGEP